MGSEVCISDFRAPSLTVKLIVVDVCPSIKSVCPSVGTPTISILIICTYLEEHYKPNPRTRQSEPRDMQTSCHVISAYTQRHCKLSTAPVPASHAVGSWDFVACGSCRRQLNLSIFTAEFQSNELGNIQVVDCIDDVIDIVPSGDRRPSYRRN